MLAVSMVLEGANWVTAMRAFGAVKGDQGWWQAIRRSKDPPAFTVLFEDSAAAAGLLIASGGIFLSHVTGDGRWDGIASIAIGLVLGVVAIPLARESKDLLIGERAAPALVRAITEEIDRRPDVTRVGDVLDAVGVVDRHTTPRV